MNVTYYTGNLFRTQAERERFSLQMPVHHAKIEEERYEEGLIMDIWKELEAEGVNRHLLAEVRFLPGRPRRGGGSTRPDSKPPICILRQGRLGSRRSGGAVRGEPASAGPKATGKNVLAENLAALFGRPVWDISMHINVDAASLIGTDTLKGGEVCFREGPVCQCARLGGFGILDEVNMAKNEALAVLHATLDFRRGSLRFPATAA